MPPGAAVDVRVVSDARRLPSFLDERAALRNATGYTFFDFVDAGRAAGAVAAPATTSVASPVRRLCRIAGVERPDVLDTLGAHHGRPVDRLFNFLTRLADVLAAASDLDADKARETYNSFFGATSVAPELVSYGSLADRAAGTPTKRDFVTGDIARRHRMIGGRHSLIKSWSCTTGSIEHRDAGFMSQSGARQLARECIGTDAIGIAR